MTSSSRKGWVREALSRLHKAYQIIRFGEVHYGTPNANDQKPGEVIKARLSQQALTLLEKRLNPPMIAHDQSNPIYSGYLLGQQRVLKELRDGFMQ